MTATSSRLVHRINQHNNHRAAFAEATSSASSTTATTNELRRRSRSPTHRTLSTAPINRQTVPSRRRRRVTRPDNFAVLTNPASRKHLVYLFLLSPLLGIIFLFLWTIEDAPSSSNAVTRRLGVGRGGRRMSSKQIPRQQAVILGTNRGGGYLIPPRRVDMITFPEYGHVEPHETMFGAPIQIQHGPDDKRLFSLAPEDDESLFENEYYAFDDDTNRNTYIWKHDDELKTYHCRRNVFYRDVFPNCNEFHAMDFTRRTLDDETRFIGGGSYRNVFLYSADHVNPHIIMKMGEISKEFTVENYEFMRMEGTTNAILAPHPLVVDMYGFCSFSMYSEAVMGGDIAGKAAPIYNRYDHCEENLGEKKLMKLNNLEPTTKLEWSLDMAEAVALLHNHERGLIVHDDIQLPQFLLDKDGHLKMNDFNRAEFMLYDEVHHRYCKYRNGPGNGDWRAPEEYMDLPLDEKIDIWSLGVNMYSVLTGLDPMYDACSSEDVQSRIVDGEEMHIPKQYFKRSFAETKLAEIIQECFAYEPEDRLSIGEIVLKLRAAVEENRQMHKLDGRKRQFSRVEG